MLLSAEVIPDFLALLLGSMDEGITPEPLAVAVCKGDIGSFLITYIIQAWANCFTFDIHEIARAFSRAWAKTGKRIAAKIAMIAITTSSSMSVKPFFEIFSMLFSSFEVD